MDQLAAKALREEEHERARASKARQRALDAARRVEQQIAAHKQHQLEEWKSKQTERKEMEEDEALQREMERQTVWRTRQQQVQYAHVLDKQRAQHDALRQLEHRMGAQEKKVHGQYLTRFLDPKGAARYISEKRSHKKGSLALDPLDVAHMMSSTGLSAAANPQDPSYQLSPAPRRSPAKSPFGNAAQHMF